MGDPAIKERILRSGFLIGMSIKRVTGEFGEVLNILKRHFTRVGNESVANLKLLEGFAKRMHAWITLIGAFDPTMADCRERFRRALNGGSLHVMQYATYSAHFLATACTSGASVNKVWKGGAMSRRLGRAVSIYDDDTTVVSRRAENQSTQCTRISGRLPHGFSTTHDHPQLNYGGFDAPIAVLRRRVEQRDPGREQNGDC